MAKTTRYLNNRVYTVLETNECVRLGGCENYTLYVNASDYFCDRETMEYYYDETPDNRHIFKLGDFSNFEDAKESFYRSMKDLAEELECSYEII